MTLTADAAAQPIRVFQDRAEIKAGPAPLEPGFGPVATRKGDFYADFWYHDIKKMIGTIARMFNIRRPTWLDNTDLLNIVDAAGAAADAIPDNEIESLVQSDLAICATDKSDRQTRYVLIECTGAITRNDVSRIRRNADHLAQLTGHETYALIVGKLPPENILREAEANGVRCLQPSERVVRVE